MPDLMTSPQSVEGLVEQMQVQAAVLSDVARACRNMSGTARDIAPDLQARSDLFTEAASALQGLVKDKARLDWLEMMTVEVRTPLVYGSRHEFFANPDDSFEGEEHPSDLRAKIDARLALQETPDSVSSPIAGERA